MLGRDAGGAILSFSELFHARTPPVRPAGKAQRPRREPAARGPEDEKVAAPEGEDPYNGIMRMLAGSAHVGGNGADHPKGIELLLIDWALVERSLLSQMVPPGEGAAEVGGADEQLLHAAAEELMQRQASSESDEALDGQVCAFPLVLPAAYERPSCNDRDTARAPITHSPSLVLSEVKAR